jgi:D-3-phosphoglycerate dehydrogenase / 2-oxoglutarate reductase
VIVLIADKFEKLGVDGIKALGCTTVYEPELGTERLAGAIEQHKPAVVVVRSTKVPAAVIERAGAAGVKLIIRAGAGVDNIDMAAATKASIRVSNCPGMNAIAVAELTMGLIIALDRRIVDQTNAIREGQWNKKEFAKGRGLKGMTLGVLGTGAIGAAVVKRALAFDMKVIAWSRGLSGEDAARMGVEFAGHDREDLPKVVSRCDVVTVHLASTPETKKIIDKSVFSAMKKGAYFINTSRGTVVDEAALREAMQTNGIRAGLDVYDNQPAETSAPFECPTSKLANFVGTHHCGASTDQAQNAVAEETVRLVSVFKSSGRAENCVNP